MGVQIVKSGHMLWRPAEQDVEFLLILALLTSQIIQIPGFRRSGNKL